MTDIFGDQISAHIKKLEAEQARRATIAGLEKQLKGRTGGNVMDRMTLKNAGPLASYSAKWIQGIPFLGEYADEAAQKIADFGISKGFNLNPDAAQDMRDVQAALARENPKTSLALQLAGGVTSTATPLGMFGLTGAAAKALGHLPLSGTKAGRAILAALGGGTLGGMEGAASGYGAGTDPESRSDMARKRATLGAIFGGILGTAGSVGGEVVGALQNRKLNKPIREVMNKFGVGEDAARTLLRLYQAGNVDDMVIELEKAGKGAMLVDSNQAMKASLDVIGQTPSLGGQSALTEIGKRATSTYDDLVDAMDTVFKTKPVGRAAALKQLRDAGKGTREQLWAASDASTLDPNSVAGRQLMEAMQRVPKAIFRITNNRLRMKGAKTDASGAAIAPPTPQIKFKFTKDGRVKFKEPLTVKQVHELAQAIDGTINEAKTGALGGMEGLQVGLVSLSGDLRAALKEASPAFREASDAYADEATIARATEFGYDLFTSKIKRDEAAIQLSQFTDTSSREAVLSGARSYIDDILARRTNTVGRSENEISEALGAIKILTTREFEDKVKMILPDAAASRLNKELSAMYAALETRAAVQRGAQTQGRRITQDTLAVAKMSGVPDQMVEAALSPAQAASFISRALAKNPKYIEGRNQKFMTELARVLTRNARTGGPRTAVAKDLMFLSNKSGAFTKPLETTEAMRLAETLTRSSFLPIIKALIQAQTPDGGPQ